MIARICNRSSASRTGLVLLWLVAGCGAPSPGYGGGAAFLRGAITPKSAWRAVGDLDDPSAAIDGERRTAATGWADLAVRTLLIDLNKVCLFQTVVMEHGEDETNFAPVVEIATSLNGRTFEARYRVPGTRRVTIASLSEPVLARYLRLRAAGAAERPWSLAEVHLQ